MKKQILITLVTLFCLSFSYAPRPILVFGIAGQSVAGGTGIVPDEPYTDPSILMFSNAYKWTKGIEPVDIGTGQIDRVSLDTHANQYGMGMSFARELLRLTKGKYKIALVPCAKGGSSLAQWQQAEDRDTLYGSCLNRMREALKKPNTVLGGMLFAQGEYEANSRTGCEVANMWDEKLQPICQEFSHRHW